MILKKLSWLVPLYEAIRTGILSAIVYCLFKPCDLFFAAAELWDDLFAKEPPPYNRSN